MGGFILLFGLLFLFYKILISNYFFTHHYDSVDLQSVLLFLR